MAVISLLMGMVLGQGTLFALPTQVVQEQRYWECLRQARVPEVVQIEVLALDRDVTWCPRRRGAGGRAWRSQRLTVYAKVLQVKKSATGLKQGSLIRFSYGISQLCPGLVGPSNRPQPKFLSRGQVTWALLERARRKVSSSGRSSFFQSLARMPRKSVTLPFWLAAGAKSFVAQPPSFPSLAKWDAHCDKLYPYRSSRRRTNRPTSR